MSLLRVSLPPPPTEASAGLHSKKCPQRVSQRKHLPPTEDQVKPHEIQKPSPTISLPPPLPCLFGINGIKKQLPSRLILSSVGNTKGKKSWAPWSINHNTQLSRNRSSFGKLWEPCCLPAEIPKWLSHDSKWIYIRIANGAGA